MQQTLAILKPDCLKRKFVGQVLSRIYNAGFEIVGMKMIRLTKEKAQMFYLEHKGKEFYEPLINFMTEGPIIVAVLQKDNAVEEWRALLGDTDPGEAEPNTIRHDLAENMRRNIAHGSDSLKTATREISFFFNSSELYDINIDS